MLGNIDHNHSPLIAMKPSVTCMNGKASGKYTQAIIRQYKKISWTNILRIFIIQFGHWRHKSRCFTRISRPINSVNSSRGNKTLENRLHNASSGEDST